MRITIDIDGTLCFNNTPVFLQICNDVFNLNISAQRLLSMTRADFLRQPEVQALQMELGRERFAYELGWIDFHPRTILAAQVAPDAVEGVRKLTSLGSIAYYTARYSNNRQRHALMVQATLQWLADHRFVCADNVIFCNGIAGKVEGVNSLIKKTGEKVLLVDDSYERILSTAAMYPELRSSCILVAARAKVAPVQTYNLHVLALPQWNTIDQVINRLQQGDVVTEATCTYYSSDDEVSDAPQPDPVPETPRSEGSPETPRPEITDDDLDQQYEHDPREPL